ncbi:MAG: glycoside hydrolase, partial [Pseudomonadota bacterium]|nr:glycoside hydrolase [Pseudomonadota bacterium]
AAQPDLIATADGRLLLSWIEAQASGHALKFATFADGAWSAPRTIARGDDWFVNWADTPHIAVTDDGALWAHWLQKSAAATYAYDVALVRSDDDGASWSPPVLVNDDGTPTEHGFVSLWTASPDTLGIAWLDGRETGGAGHGDHAAATADAQAAGAMTVRAATFSADLQRSGDTRVDAMACDCCQTDTALTARGPLLVYRDRTAAEIRDIAVSRLQGGRWSAGRVVHADQWTMPACPVNGPSVDARGNEAVVAWYTAAGNTPTLKLARSIDAGESFAAPVVFDSGPQVQGRVDVAYGTDAVWGVVAARGRRGPVAATGTVRRGPFKRTATHRSRPPAGPWPRHRLPATGGQWRRCARGLDRRRRWRTAPACRPRRHDPRPSTVPIRLVEPSLLSWALFP